ncbi:hypothetical protein D3C86_2117050 [compost metagenome]
MLLKQQAVRLAYVRYHTNHIRFVHLLFYYYKLGGFDVRQKNRSQSEIYKNGYKRKFVEAFDRTVYQ